MKLQTNEYDSAKFESQCNGILLLLIRIIIIINLLTVMLKGLLLTNS